MEDLTDDEFDLIDDLYFVQPYKELEDSLLWANNKLEEVLRGLISKGFVKILSDHDTELDLSSVKLNDLNWNKYFYLATKKGLMVHNGF